LYNLHIQTYNPMKTKLHLLAATLFAVLITSPLDARVKLPRIISDGMVLQRDTELKIWDWAGPGET
jgi:sialate O-acetylesterase